ncbi:MAG: GreA/GreB family elongation factor [Caldilineaceae bacterium]|nr:GreA/GreB family elongation factor [Caldilineaceae bacterium]HRJ41791.1 GreA/GreB family elongation factor [Caldilineaceae bacterium]
MDANGAINQVGLGTHIEVDLIDADGNTERMDFALVPASQADMGRGLLSADAPLGKAVRGKFVGATIPYQMGDIRQIRIVSVGPGQSSAGVDAETRRAEVLQKALDDAERTNAQMFASSYSGKWGDYDPDGVDGWDE